MPYWKTASIIRRKEYQYGFELMMEFILKTFAVIEKVGKDEPLSCGRINSGGKINESPGLSVSRRLIMYCLSFKEEGSSVRMAVSLY